MNFYSEELTWALLLLLLMVVVVVVLLPGIRPSTTTTSLSSKLRLAQKLPRERPYGT
jgi:hypothetical protein